MGGAFRPSSDHTLGTPWGHSLQMESAGAPTGTVVRLYSQVHTQSSLLVLLIHLRNTHCNYVTGTSKENLFNAPSLDVS